MRTTAVLAICLATAIGAATPGQAGPWKGGHGPADGSAVILAGGPPPWAPAHGYRAKHGRGHGHAYYDDEIIVLPSSGIGHCNRQLVGTVVGAAAGGLGGSQIGKGDGNTAAIIAGVIVGGILGGEVGRSMDEADLACAGHALEYLPTGRAAVWDNPDTGARYSVEPTATYESREGRYCREYTARAYVGGDVEDVRGVACRRADETWEIVS